jgi:hypothetical protein
LCVRPPNLIRVQKLYFYGFGKQKASLAHEQQSNRRYTRESISLSGKTCSAVWLRGLCLNYLRKISQTWGSSVYRYTIYSTTSCRACLYLNHCTWKSPPRVRYLVEVVAQTQTMISLLLQRPCYGGNQLSVSSNYILSVWHALPAAGKRMIRTWQSVRQRITEKVGISLDTQTLPLILFLAFFISLWTLTIPRRMKNSNLKV